MKDKYVKHITCSKCGNFAVTYDGKNCISIKFGKVCGGKIYKTKSLRKTYVGLRKIVQESFEENHNADLATEKIWDYLNEMGII